MSSIIIKNIKNRVEELGSCFKMKQKGYELKVSKFPDFERMTMKYYFFTKQEAEKYALANKRNGAYYRITPVDVFQCSICHTIKSTDWEEEPDICYRCEEAKNERIDDLEIEIRFYRDRLHKNKNGNHFFRNDSHSIL